MARQRDQKMAEPAQRRPQGQPEPARAASRKADGVQEISSIVTRLREAASLPDILAAGFDAFEAVRQVARACEDRVPALFATFMTTADAAVDGREAVTIALVFPRPRRAGAGVSVPAAGASVEEIAGELAGLGALLRDRLARAAALAATAADRAACTQAAQAAGRIRQLMTRADDDACPW
jgi:hypothetical protein